MRFSEDLRRRRHLLGLGLGVSALALTAGVAMPAWSQTAATEASSNPTTDDNSRPKSDATAEDIVVTGYRQSLNKSLNIKRKSDQIVDAISAEDINEFPDQNVVEALGRITGVQIQRDDNGTGDRFQIRGLSDVRIEIDGQRQVGGRFDGGVVGSALPSELFGTVEAVKTQSASDTEGGTGGIVRFVTRDPLDLPKDFVATASGQGIYSNNARSFGYKAAGTIAKVFRDTPIGDFGILASYTRNRTTGQADQYISSSGYVLDNTLSGDFNGNGTSNEPSTTRPYGDATVVDKFGDGLVRPAGAIGAQYETFKRTERSYNINAQWKPIDTLSIYFRTTQIRQDNTNSNLFINATARPLSNWDPNSLVIKNQVVVAGTIINAGNVISGSQAPDFDVTQNTLQAGFKWNATDRLNVSFKFEDGRGDTRNPILIPILDNSGGQPTSVQFDSRTKVPTVRILAPGSTTEAFNFNQPFSAAFNPNVIGLVDFDLRERQRDRAYQLDLDYNLGLGWFSKLEVGGRYNIQRSGLTRVEYSQFDFDGVDPQLPFRFQPLSQLAQSIPGIVVPYDRDHSFGGNNQGNLPTSLLTIDPYFFRSQAYFDTYRSSNFKNADGTPITGFRNLQAERNSEFKIWAGYVKLDLEGDTPLVDIPFRGNVGLRVVHTKQRVFGLFSSADGSTSTPGFVTANNTEYLPSLSLVFDVAKNVIARFGAGRTLARQSPELLTPTVDYRPTENLESIGNANLKPQTVNGLDLSVEWYFNKSGLLSVAGFYKDQQNIAAQFTTIECLPDTVQPAIYTDQGGKQVTNQNGVDVCTAAGLGSPADLRSHDGFTVTRVGNIGSDHIKGVEVGYQQGFTFLPSPLDGLGIIANYTYTTGKNPLVSPLGFTEPLLGVSKNSYNLTAYYEKYGFSTRLSYNYRSSFLNNTLTGTQENIGVSPAIRSGYGQLDASASYQINTAIKLTFDGINLLKASQKDYADFKNALLRKTFTDRRFFLGAQINF